MEMHEGTLKTSSPFPSFDAERVSPASSLTSVSQSEDQQFPLLSR